MKDQMIELKVLQLVYRAIDTREYKDAAAAISSLNRSLPEDAQAQDRVDILYNVLREVPAKSPMEQVATRAMLNEFSAIPPRPLDREKWKQDTFLREKFMAHAYKDQTSVAGSVPPSPDIVAARRIELIATQPWVPEGQAAYSTPVAERDTRKHDPLLQNDLMAALNAFGIFSADPKYISRHACMCVEIQGDDVYRVGQIIEYHKSLQAPLPVPGSARPQTVAVALRS